ncbi:MAG: 16S rRNA (uracil(1498)-N(3))-methyltransferase [Dehalococcoidia bacterium]|nr:16S rRNA (uracil(1498)-N(3))-methyltransferase [Dehalococcoidia bacterium]
MAHIPRLYVPGRLGPGPVTLDRDQSQRLAAVMRVREGDPVQLFSGDGREWHATVTTVTKQAVHLTVGQPSRQEPQPAVTLELWCAVVRANRFDWAIEKAVELGAGIIRPMICDYSARGDTAGAAKLDRWQRIVIEAAEQSGRLWLPVIEPPATFAAVLARHHGALVLGDPAGMPWPHAAALLPPRGTVALAIGPEGGFSPAEGAAARAAGALAVQLGPHILRTETAAAAGLALLRATLL